MPNCENKYFRAGLCRYLYVPGFLKSIPSASTTNSVRERNCVLKTPPGLGLASLKSGWRRRHISMPSSAPQLEHLRTVHAFFCEKGIGRRHPSRGQMIEKPANIGRSSHGRTSSHLQYLRMRGPSSSAARPVREKKRRKISSARLGIWDWPKPRLTPE